MKGSPADENVEFECLETETDLKLELALDLVRKGFSEEPKLLIVRMVDAGVTFWFCRGVMPGLAEG